MSVILDFCPSFLSVAKESLSEMGAVDGPAVTGLTFNPLTDGDIILHAWRINVDTVDGIAQFFSGWIGNAWILEMMKGNSFTAHFVTNTIPGQAF